MKSIVGIDREGHYKSALHLLSRLGFRDNTAELLHVLNPAVLAESGLIAPSYAAALAIDESWASMADSLLEIAQQEAMDFGLPSTVLHQIGKPSTVLMERASEIHADLVAVGSTHKSRYGALVLGSVGRALTIGAHQSLLVAKKDHLESGPLTVVFATDGSDYADACLRMLVRMAPKGIQRLVVVSAVDGSDRDRPKGEVCAHIERLVDHLIEAEIHADGQVVEGSPTEVIDAMMKSVNADMLVLGAQGHGFFNRLLVGSVSLQEVVATPHSVLLLRLP